MTFDRPKGGFAKTEINHYGVGAWCCYDSVEFRLQNEVADNTGNTYTLVVFGRLDGKDRHMNNYTEIFMKKEQVAELIRYLEERITEGKQ